ncbi:MAG TPA: SGNH/GDSL hydrolase family protein [Acidobacteriaceae bacterium]
MLAAAAPSFRRIAATACTVAMLASLSGCGNVPPTFYGSGPYTRVVFLGDSLTAGFQNGSLLDTQQVHGYDALVAQQAGFSDVLPLIAAPGAPAVLKLVSVSPIPVVEQTPGTTTGRDNPALQVTNLAVPGHTLHDLIYHATTLSPATDEDIITDLVLGFPQNEPSTQITQAIGYQPSTIFLWIGNEDALLADDTGDPSAMTPLSSFAADYATLIGALKAKTGAHLVVANIPDVTAIPYMTPATTILAELAHLSGLPPVVIEQALGIVPGDLVNEHGLADIKADIVKVQHGQMPTPLPGSDVLTAAEIVTVQSNIAAYNQVIGQLVGAAGGTVVDVHSYFASLASGVTIGGYTATTGYLGGIFGLDGVHPTNTGYALLANQFITATNTAFGLATPAVNVAAVASADPYFPPNLPATLSMHARIPLAAARQASQLMRGLKTTTLVNR